MTLYIWLALCALTAVATGQTITPTNWTNANQDEQISDSIGLSMSVGDNMVPLGPILALTTRAHKGIPPTGLSDPVFLLDASNQLELKANEVALISCDPYPGEIQADATFGVAVKTNVTAILFYSQDADFCNLTDYTGTFPWIYTTKSRAQTTSLLGDLPSANLDSQVYVRIGNRAGPAHPANGTAGGGNKPTSNPLGPSPSTAVAMIILYSITGIITALFLVIIITGAIRAHRHPERYGPRNITGRPRQSRARGLGRAIVDTLPIVKFGERPDPKPTDVELADNSSATQQSTTRDVAESATDGTDQTEQHGHARDSVEGGIAAAVNTEQTNTDSDKPENQGCSICTEDFEAGQDQRVLPCDHRFHPECIDPWLLNVSGTCPLCRIDLRPSADENAEVDENGNPVDREGDTNGDLAPPLANDVAGQQPRMGIRRSLLIGLMGVRGPDRMTQEERIYTARQLRRQQLATIPDSSQTAPAEAAAEEETQQRRRDRLRRVFGIRTRRAGQVEEPTPSDEEPEARSRNQDSLE